MNGGNSYRVKLRERGKERRKGGRKEEKKRKKGDEKCW